MKEAIKVFNLSGDILRIEERDNYYSNIRKRYFQKKQINTKIRTIRLLLMNSRGRIYLQKRSSTKEENPGLYDKTIGGHVAFEDTPEITLVKECAQELGIPATVVSEENFANTSSTTDLKVIAVIRKIERVPCFISRRILGKKTYKVNHDSNFYIGYYDGSIRFSDGESSGIEVFAPGELEQELRSKPSKFTEDLKFMIARHHYLIKPLKTHKDYNI